MIVTRDEDFEKLFRRLSIEVKALYEKQEQRLRKNANDHRLHVKVVKKIDDVFSFRITRRYRAFFYYQDTDTIIVFDIDHRKDIYRKL